MFKVLNTVTSNGSLNLGTSNEIVSSDGLYPTALNSAEICMVVLSAIYSRFAYPFLTSTLKTLPSTFKATLPDFNKLPYWSKTLTLIFIRFPLRSYPMVAVVFIGFKIVNALIAAT